MRFFWIDALRGVAALAIVVFHYHHFFLADAHDRSSLPSVETFPYASLLAPFYGPYAAKAVELFWLISGFVFCHVYLHRDVSAWNFGVARFARLYPLHFATLVYVACLQYVSVSSVGHWQVYENNDIRHFILQLFFSSNWITWSRGLSFNGPIWSVSLEIVVYGVFFISLFVLRRSPVLVSLALCVAAWGWFIMEPFRLPLIQSGVFECAGYFFLGSLVYALRPGATVMRWAALTGLGLVGFLLGVASGSMLATIAGLAVIFVSIAARLDELAPETGARLSVLGDISYSVYLIHVPLQMTVLLVADVVFDGSRSFAGSYLTLPIYLVVSIAAAIAVHRLFERPAGGAIRRTLIR